MVETMSIDRSSVTPRIGHDHATVLSRPSMAWLATTSEMRIPAAPGMGRPTTYLPGLVGAPFSLVARTLKRASLIAPQAVKRKEATRAALGWWGDVHW